MVNAIDYWWKKYLKEKDRVDKLEKQLKSISPHKEWDNEKDDCWNKY